MNFDLGIKNDKYPNYMETERLCLKKEETDPVTVLYSIYEKDEQTRQIGNIVLLFDGEIWYKLYKSYRNKGYMTEAMTKVLEVTYQKQHYLSIEKTNIKSKHLAKKLGFKRTKIGMSIDVYTKSLK